MTGELSYLSRLLVAFDHYADADVAISWGSRLASALHLSVLLVHIQDPARLRDNVQVAELMGRDGLALLASDERLRDINVTPRMVLGRPGEELARISSEHPGTLVLLVASAGASDDGPVAMSEPFGNIVRNITMPYLVIPEGARVPERMKRIVVGFDRSDLAGDVLRIARVVAHSLDVEVIAVEAVEPGKLPPGEFADVEPLVEPDHVRIRGRASRTLLTTARTRDAAFIAVGSHGAGASSRVLMGSTTEWLIQNADRPVLVVPERGPTA